MPVFGTQNFGSGGGTTYSIDKSCMFDYASSSYLTRTPGSAGNRRTWTMSVWLKMTRLASSTSGGLVVYKAGSTEFRWSDSNNNLYLNSGSVYKQTTSVARDFAGWFHLCIIADTPQGTASERLKVYINGTVPALTTNSAPAQNFDFDVNNTVAQNIGKEGGNYWDGYMSEFHLIDGTAKAVGDFGETNDQGVWIPKKYTGGGYGTCGFHLDFADSSDLGDDNSGQGNDWTATNMGTDHQVSDSPTTNYPILNYNDADRESSAVLSEVCRKWLNTNTARGNDARATFGFSSGKWYWETKIVALGQSGVNREWIGVVGPEWDIAIGSGNSFVHYSGNNGYGYGASGQKANNNTEASYGTGFALNDIIGTAVDIDNGKIWWSLNGTYQASGDPAAGTNAAYTGLSGMFQPVVACDYGTGNSGVLVNFGQQAFNTAPPTGFKALNTDNLTPSISDPSAHFQVVPYTGSGGSTARVFSGSSDMQPDMVWIKNRSATDHAVGYDAARGTTKQIEPSNRSDETTQSTGLTAFGSDGFTTGALDALNTSSESFIAWCWNAGNSGSANTDGATDTTSTFSNATAGIFCSTYTGTGSQTTFGHGLGKTPATWVCFQRSNNDHHNINNWEFGITAYSEKGNLDHDGYPESSSSQMPAASSTTITVGTDPGINGSGRTYVAWGWAEIEHFSRFGTYIGNGSADGAFGFCGFSPAFVMIKRTDANSNWVLYDTGRSPDNEAHEALYANTNAAEFGMGLDIVSNGFKTRTTDGNINADGGTYIFMAFAKYPMGGEDLSPATARA